MDKVYSLPDLPRLPYSDTQALLVRLLEYRDFSALRPLMDELEAVGDTKTAKKIQLILLQNCHPPKFPHSASWDFLAEGVVYETLHYLYSWEGAAEELAKRVWKTQKEIDTELRGYMTKVAGPLTTYPSYSVQDTQ